MLLTFDNFRTSYDIPDQLGTEVQAMYDDNVRLRRELTALQQSVAEYRIKSETANAHPTKFTKLERHYAKQRMYGLVSRVEQLELK